MSHFLDRLTFFTRAKAEFADGHGMMTTEDRRWEDGYRKRWQHDKIVRSTHGVNCTGSCSWKIYVKGGIVTWETQQTDYPRTRPGPAQSRAARLRARRQLQLVSLFRQPREIPAGALAPAEAVARGARTADAGRGLGVDRRGSRRSARLTPEARPRRLRARDLGRGQRDHRRRQRLHRQDLWPRPRHRLLADPGDVDGQLRRRRALSVAARRRLHVLLRLVLRPAAGLAADLGRADRRAGKRRLVQFRLPHPVGLERAADAHARCAFLYRGPLQGHQERRDLPGLFRGVQVRRSLAVAEAGHRCGAGDGDGPRHPARIPPRPPGQVFRGLCAPVHRHADAGAAGEAGRSATCPTASCAPPTSPTALGEANNPEWKTVAFDETSGEIVVPQGSIGFRWGEKGKWNLEAKDVGQPGHQAASVADRYQGRHRRRSASPISATASTIISPAPTIPTC